MHIIENYYIRLKYTPNQKPPLPPRLLLHLDLLDLLGLLLILKIKIQESAIARTRRPQARRLGSKHHPHHKPTVGRPLTYADQEFHPPPRVAPLVGTEIIKSLANTTSDHHTNQNKARAPTHDRDRPISRTRENAAFEHWAPKGQHNPKEQAPSDGKVFFLQALSTRAKCPLGPLNYTRTDPGHSSRHSRSVKISSSPDYGHSI